MDYPLEYIISRLINLIFVIFIILTGKASTELLLALSKKIPTEWYRLGIHLGFDFGAVDGIQSNEHFQSPQDKALEMLKLWLKHNGDYATVEVLAGALGKAKRQDLIHWLQTQVQYTAAVIRICRISCTVVHEDAMLHLQLEIFQGISWLSNTDALEKRSQLLFVILIPG